MRCKSCGSENVAKFTAEVAIHFRGLKNLDKPHVFVFPEVTVCFDCGFAEFLVPERELVLLQEGRAATV